MYEDLDFKGGHNTERKKLDTSKYNQQWDFINMFTPIEVWLLIAATIVAFSVIYSVLSLF